MGVTTDATCYTKVTVADVLVVLSLSPLWVNICIYRNYCFFFFLLVKFVAGSRGSGCTSYDLHEEGDLPRWFHILWRLRRIRLTQLQEGSLEVSTYAPVLCCFLFLSARLHNQGGIDTNTYSSSLAFKKVKCGVSNVKVILPTQHNTHTKIRVWLYLYSD